MCNTLTPGMVEELRLQRQNRKMKSLVELCIHTLAKNIEEASPEALEQLPVALVWRTYVHHVTTWSVFSPSLNASVLEKAKAHTQVSQESIRGWRLFSSVLLKELTRVPLGLYWFRWQERVPVAHALPRLVKLSTSPSLDFLAHLTIHKVWMYRASDLMALADMPNLVILELSDLDNRHYADRHNTDPEAADSVLSDRLVRGWSEKESPFSNLRILTITSVYSSVTVLTLQYASRFPSLVYCVLRSASFSTREHGTKRRAPTLGWRLEKDTPPWEKAEEAEAETFRYHFCASLPTNYESSIRKTIQLKWFDHSKRTGVFLAPYRPADSGAHMPNEPPSENPVGESGAVDRPWQRYLLWHGFWCTWPWLAWKLYARLGEECGNADLSNQGCTISHRASHMPPTRQTRTGATTNGRNESPEPCDLDEVFPPKPMLTVVLGSGPVDDPCTLEKRNYRPSDSLGNAVFPNGAPWVSMRPHIYVRRYSPDMFTSAPAEAGGAKARNAAVQTDPEPSKEPGSSNTSTAAKRAGSGAASFRPRKRRDFKDFF